MGLESSDQPIEEVGAILHHGFPEHLGLHDSSRFNLSLPEPDDSTGHHRRRRPAMSARPGSRPVGWHSEPETCHRGALSDPCVTLEGRSRARISEGLNVNSRPRGHRAAGASPGIQGTSSRGLGLRRRSDYRGAANAQSSDHQDSADVRRRRRRRGLRIISGAGPTEEGTGSSWVELRCHDPDIREAGDAQHVRSSSWCRSAGGRAPGPVPPCEPTDTGGRQRSGLIRVDEVPRDIGAPIVLEVAGGARRRAWRTSELGARALRGSAR